MSRLKRLLIIPLLLLSVLLFAQDRTITGKVVSTKDNADLVGATIAVKGRTTGTSTAPDGSFSIMAPAGRVVLVVSSVGFTTKDQVVEANQSNIVINLSEEAQQLGEVVVTALGVTKNKRTLNFATQTVETKDIVKAREVNVANSLSGKVAGLDVVRSSQGVGSNVRIVLRGDRSINGQTGQSQALIIIDGIPGDIGSLNPDDIASMNVLKGSSASALYGSDAQNGAIIIVTKKGAAGKVAVSFNSSYQAEKAVNLHDFQNEFSTGSQGQYLRNAENTWGVKIAGQQVRNWSIDPADDTIITLKANPDNYDNFFSTGSMFTNGVTLSGGGERIQSYFSYTNTYGKGIVDNNTFLRHNFNFRTGGNITDKLSFDTKITYFDQKADNYVEAGEDFDNVNRQIVRLPTNISTEYASTHYQFYNANRELKQNYWNPGSNGGENPYWVKYNCLRFFKADNVKGLASLTYRFTPELSLMLRTGLNRYNNHSEQKNFRNTYVISEFGTYNIQTNTFTESNNDALLSYNSGWGDFTLNANLGGNLKSWKTTSLNSGTSILVNENIFTLANAQSGTLSSSQSLSQYKKNSLYGSADIGFRRYLVLSLTGRNDWSSALPASDRSYFFGSAGLTAIISDMVKLPELISFLKVRGSVAETGIDPAPYQTKEYYSITPGGGIAKSQINPADTLKPEITRSFETGVDINFLQNRIGLEFTYYKTNSKNQLIGVATPPASGYSSKFINAGNVQNKGIEITLNVTPIKSQDFTWSFYINYAKNVNEVLELYPGSPEFELASDGFMTRTRVIEGKPFGEMYSRGFVRDSATGQIIVDTATGIPQITAGQTVYIGNSRPDWIGGFGNRFTYKNFELSFLISARMGGNITSFTNANLYGDGMVEQTIAGRDGFVFDGITPGGAKNTKATTAEAYWSKVGGRNTPVGEIFTYSSSNIRLRELVLSYIIPKSTWGRAPIKSASISFTGRNLFFFKNDAEGFDPELVVSTDRGLVGNESFCLPYTRTFGLNLNLTF